MTPKENEAAEKLANETLERHEKELLKDIFHQYNIAFSSNNPSQIHRTIAYFSALLIKLSRQAEKSTQKLVYLTYALLAFTIALLFVGIIQIRVMQNQNLTTKVNTDKEQENSSQIQTDKKLSSTVQPLPESPIIKEKRNEAKTK